MKVKIILTIIILLTVLLNCIPAIGKLLLIKTGNTIPFDAILHAVYYFSIGLVITSLPWIKRKSLIISLFVLFLFSLSIEVVQGFIPGRTFSISDILSNLLGICVAYLLQRILRKPEFKSA